MNFEYLTHPDIYQYTLKRSSKAPVILQELWDYTHVHTDAPQMLTGPIEGNFLGMLVAMTGAKNILEIGTFTGYSALWMARALPEDGKIITCDVSERNTAIAQTFFDRTQEGKKIEIQKGPALQTVQQMIENKQPEFDLIFVDADKENYPRYFQKCLQLTRVGGLLLFDNTLWGGKVLGQTQDADTKGIDRLNIMVEHDQSVQNVLLTIRDGIQLVRKLQ